MQHLYRKIHEDPKFIELCHAKNRFSWILAIIVMVIYFSFVLIVAFQPQLFAIPISDGSVISWGIPIGAGVIILSFLLTGVYVIKANKTFDKLNEELLEKYKEAEHE